MKTRLYAIITGLLMAACATSYGQEIVSEFMIQEPNKSFLECNLYENSDGTLMFRTLIYDANTYEDWQHLLMKLSPEGEVLDSLLIDAYADYSYLMRNPLDEESYILTEDVWVFDTIDSLFTATFRMWFIDADLNIYNDMTIPLFTPDTNSFYYTYNPWFIDTQNDFIISTWVNDELHMTRLGLDGTVKASAITTGPFPFNYEQEPCGADTSLLYSDMGFGVFSESPLTYYLLGGYYPSSGPFAIIGYFFDADFNIIRRHIYENFSDNIAFDGGNSEHILPLDDGTYLIATQLSQLSPSIGGVGLAKFDMDHNPICTSPLFGSNHCYPRQTLIADENIIYQLYDIGGGYTTHKWALVRLNGDLNIDWEYTLPQSQVYGFMGSSLIMLKNGNIAAASICRKNAKYSAVFVILHDGYDSAPETTNIEPSFTIYPNPVKDLLSLRFDDGEKPESVELYDLVGRLVASRRNDIESIDMSAMSSGVYTLCVTMKDGEKHYEKIVKE